MIIKNMVILSASLFTRPPRTTMLDKKLLPKIVKNYVTALLSNYAQRSANNFTRTTKTPENLPGVVLMLFRDEERKSHSRLVGTVGSKSWLCV